MSLEADHCHAPSPTKQQHPPTNPIAITPDFIISAISCRRPSRNASHRTRSVNRGYIDCVSLKINGTNCLLRQELEKTTSRASCETDFPAPCCQRIHIKTASTSWCSGDDSIATNRVVDRVGGRAAWAGQTVQPGAHPIIVTLEQNTLGHQRRHVEWGALHCPLAYSIAAISTLLTHELDSTLLQPRILSSKPAKPPSLRTFITCPKPTIWTPTSLSITNTCIECNSTSDCWACAVIPATNIKPLSKTILWPARCCQSVCAI